jgi:hypothetical protein
LISIRQKSGMELTMRGFAIGMLLVFAAVTPGVAESRQFPYDAVVEIPPGESQDIYVRSGPGSKYYPTARLKAGDRVTVRRHDPGGWYMIVPPTGSFSWVPARYVRRGTDPATGTISTNNVIARVGSFESDVRDVVSAPPLRQGDEVRILGEKMLPAKEGETQLWYRIEPPRGEWRWMMGKYLVPQAAGAGPESAGSSAAGPIARQTQRPAAPDVGELATVPAATGGPTLTGPQDRSSAESSGLVERPLVRIGALPPELAAVPVETEPPVEQPQPASEVEGLDLLDSRLQAMVEKPTGEWDFQQIESDYLKLRESTPEGGLRQQIESRLVRITQYKRVRSQYDDVMRLASETTRRDAALAALQQQQEQELLKRRPLRFDGAGIVQRAATGARAQYVLLAPGGRVLAYLQPGDGVDLEPWIGKPAGVHGPRNYQRELLADMIVVHNLTAVRLSP